MHQALSGAKIYYAIRNRGSSLAAKQWRGKTVRKNEPHNRIYSTNAACVSFATVGFVKLGHDCDRQKFLTPPPPLALVNRNYPTKRNEYIEGGREGDREKVNRKFTHAYTFERAFPACFSGF